MHFLLSEYGFRLLGRWSCKTANLPPTICIIVSRCQIWILILAPICSLVKCIGIEVCFAADDGTTFFGLSRLDSLSKGGATVRCVYLLELPTRAPVCVSFPNALVAARQDFRTWFEQGNVGILTPRQASGVGARH